MIHPNQPTSNAMICAICLDELEEESVSLPGCGHRFHTACILNCVRHDTRCPVCRAVPEGVFSATTSTDVRPTFDQIRLDLRRFTERVRRARRRDPELNAMYNNLLTLRRDLCAKRTELQKEFDARCRSIWRTDPVITKLRKEAASIRRRELRVERTLSDGISQAVGQSDFAILV